MHDSRGAAMAAPLVNGEAARRALRRHRTSRDRQKIDAATPVRRCLNELRVEPMPVEPVLGPVRDHSEDAVRASAVGEKQLHLSDQLGNLWTGQVDVALA